MEEEEEAEVESDDRDTYTIEDEYHSRARHNARGDITQTAALAGGFCQEKADCWCSNSSGIASLHYDLGMRDFENSLVIV